MSITREEVLHVARLARLRLSEGEIELYTQQLGKILDYINKLNEVDTERVEATSHVIPLRNVFREDKEGPSLDIKEVLSNAPQREGRFFRVLKIIE